MLECIFQKERDALETRIKREITSVITGGEFLGDERASVMIKGKTDRRFAR